MPSLSYDIKSAYETLVAEFEEAAHKSNCGFVKTSGPLLACFRPSASDRNEFEIYFHLQEWKARSSSGKEHVHILIHVKERIQCTNPVLLAESIVRVGYFLIDGNQAKLLHRTHFDYGQARDAHPIFHAQMTGEVFDIPPAIAKEIEFTFEQLPCEGCFPNARIPTSDMTLPSVLLCLAADHLKFEIFRGFYEKVQELQRAMPQPIYDKTKASIHAAPDHLRSSHWFAHTPSEKP